MHIRTATGSTFKGNAEVNGVATNYRIVVEDNAESGAGSDRFSITTGKRILGFWAPDNGQHPGPKVGRRVFGSGGRTRTYDQAVNSRPLYH